MKTTTRITAVEVCEEESGALMAVVKTFDSHCAEVRLAECTHNADSWADLTQGIAKAISMLGLETK